VLEALRSFVSGWVAKALLILLVGSFAMWGVSGNILGNSDTSTIAQVGETKVSVREYLNAYNSNMSEVQTQAGRRLTRDEGRIFGVEERALSNVVTTATMDEFARTQKLSLSDNTLAQLIAANPVFHDSSGKFDRDRFRLAIQQAQMRESDFIATENQYAIRSQIARAFSTGNLLPDVFKNALGEFTQEQRKFNYITITPALAGKPADPTAGQLKKYFEENKTSYKAPEYRKLILLAVEPKDLADEKSVSQKEVSDDYDKRLATYSQPEQRRVQQIVFSSQEKADAAIKSLAEGGVFETILSDNNNKIKLSDADLGLVVKEKLPESLQEEAFSLEINTPSKVFDGTFGPTMIRITEIQEANVTLLSDIEDNIRKELALRKARIKITDMVEAVEDMRAGGASIEQVGQRLKLKTRAVDAVDRAALTPDGTVMKDLPASTKLLEQVFGLEVGAEANPVEFGKDGYVWTDVPARDREQKEVTDKVKADWISAQSSQGVSNLASELQKKLESGTSFDDIAKLVNTEIKTTALLKRAVAEGAFNRAANLAGFDGGAKNVAIVKAENNGEQILLMVTEITRPEARIIALPEREIQIANQGIAEDLLVQLVNNLREGYNITQNPTLIDQAITRGSGGFSGGAPHDPNDGHTH